MKNGKCKMQKESHQHGMPWATWCIVVAAALCPGGLTQLAAAEMVTAALNGLEIALDGKTGSVLRLAHAGPGLLLEATASQAGIVEVGQPLDSPFALRRAPRFSSGAKVAKGDGRIEIHWERLAAAEAKPQAEGTVSSVVTLQAAPDGRSVELRATVENRSARAISQVLFPDLVGLVPQGDPARTELRSGGVVLKPFTSLTPCPLDPMVASPHVSLFSAAGVYSPMIIRWLDLGTLRGGLSLHGRQWGLDPTMTVMLQLVQPDKRLRVMVASNVTVPPGGKWASPAYWLTPHQAGWAKGIEPYRDWVQQHLNRVVPLPEHVRRGLGFRTVWLSRNYPADPQDANFTFADLPGLAQESKEHGLDQLVLWGVHEYFLLPLPPFHKHLGGDEGMVRAVAECRELGVDVAPFISVCNAREKTAARYGLKVVGNYGWTYHPEFVPRFNPPYAGLMRCVQISTRHPIWQREVLDSCKRLVDMGVPSLSWDQYFIEPPEPNVLSLTRQIRKHSRQRDPQSTFSAEEINAMDVSCDYLDFTWNWDMARDCQPATSVFPSPRINWNIDTSALEAKTAFVQNRYLNVQPRKPDGTNGSDRIASHPELSRALKQCAKLRAQFLPYFVDGTLVGDCVLGEPCPDAAVGTYILKDRLLAIVLNTGPRRAIALNGDLGPWMPPGTGGYEIRCFDGAGGLVRTVASAQASVRLVTDPLEPLDFTVFEIVGR
jgi:hypothetical protein